MLSSTNITRPNLMIGRMCHYYKNKISVFFLGLSLLQTATAQEKTVVVDSTETTRTIIAGRHKNTPSHNFFFGKHYRAEWNTPVKVHIALLDSIIPGAQPYKAGGGRQSKSVRVHDAEGHEYVLRSIDKSFGRALPETYRGTFVQAVIDDQVTIGHPYSGLTIAPMAKAAGVYHTTPGMAYLPSQAALDSFNDDFGNRAYFIEQRPDGDWSVEPNFGNSKKIISTTKMTEKVMKDNDNRIDQLQYVRSRLFDFLIGDWGRHEDQWRWATIEEGDKKIYKPIPRDRDQAYTKFDGKLTKIMLGAAHLGYLQSFDYKIKRMRIYGYTARHLDRFCANEPTREQWIDIAEDMQNALTDDVIEKAVRQLPPEVYPISGPDILAKLKARRDHLKEYAEQYYAFLAKHVDVVGSEGSDYFKVTRIDDEQTLVEVYNIRKDRTIDATPFYSRVFKTDETKDVRLFGLDGKDKYTLDGMTRKGINIRVVGGTEKDTIIDNSYVRQGKRKTNVYDDDDNYFHTTSETHLHLKGDSEVHAYDYKEFEYNKRGMKFAASYSNPDHVYVGIGYGFDRHRWRKYPYGFAQAVYLRYSISQNAISLLYEGTFYQAVGKWNLTVSANYDPIRWTNFFGLGNETVKATGNWRYYRMRTNEDYLGVGLNRIFGAHHRVTASANYQAVEIIDDAGRYVHDNFVPGQLNYFDHEHFVGGNIDYTYQNVNNKAVPTKGVVFYSGFSHTFNLQSSAKDFTAYSGALQGYLPLFGHFSVAVRTGLNAIWGTPEFYQYASVGGGQSLRGFRRDRFWGNTAFYDENELRYIRKFRSYIMNGRVGVLAFVDDGRVWYAPERSDVWHFGYGGGVLLAPFDKFSLTLVYGMSDDDHLLHLRFTKLLW